MKNKSNYNFQIIINYQFLDNRQHISRAYLLNFLDNRYKL